jgi:hypothetical protein
MFKLLNVLFGCTHKHCTFPISARKGHRRSPAATMTGTYVVCLDCGKEFAYDWHKMRMVPDRTLRRPAVVESATEAGNRAA